LSRVVVLGYVNLEHVVALNRDVEPNVTALVCRRHTPEGGRLGGCASYIATGLAERGLTVEVVSFLGVDEGADIVERALLSAGVGVEGLERGPQPRTGSAWLPYAPSGKSYCIYDPGGALPLTLTERQQAVCRQAAWLVAAVGPPGPCAEAVALLPRTASLCWPVKADPASFPPPLARDLADRADVVVFSDVEADFLAQTLGGGWRERLARPGAFVVETRGSHGLRYWADGAEHAVEPDAPLEVFDTIGAGDRFCAGLLSAHIGAGEPAAVAVAAGIESAAALLADRVDRDAIRS
jgi:ribokinase